MAFTQVYGYDVFAGVKRTTMSEYNIAFLNSLPIGAIVYRESEEWNTKTEQWDMVITPLGTVKEGEFGDNVFERTTR